MSAFLAGIGTAGMHRMEPSASIANVAVCFVAAMENFHDLSQTRGVIWILDLELLKGVFGHGGYPYLRLRDSLLHFLLVVKGYEKFHVKHSGKMARNPRRLQRRY
jgi:hypothetical protein